MSFPWHKISIHPRLAAVIELALALSFWWWLPKLTAFWMLAIWIVVRFVLLAGLVRLCYYPPGWKRLGHLFALYLFNFGLLLYLLFVEWVWSVRLSGLIFILLPSISFFFLPSVPEQVLLSFKSQRRIRLAMTILGLTGIWVGIFASIILQIFNVHFWLWLFLGSFVTALSSYWWWKEYEITETGKMRVWAVVMGVMTLELAWVVYLLPLGYFISGFLIAWFWYGLWILTRFYLTKVGINWKKQAIFIITNGILLLLFLIFFARWR